MRWEFFVRGFGAFWDLGWVGRDRRGGYWWGGVVLGLAAGGWRGFGFCYEMAVFWFKLEGRLFDLYFWSNNGLFFWYFWLI
jgi:hypothetical protein